MTVRLRDARRFDVPPARLLEVLCDPAFQEARSAHLGTIEATCVRRIEGDATVLVLDEARDTGWPPHVFESRTTTRWAGTRATWTLEQTGGPGEAAALGTLEVRPDGAGSRLVLDGELNVRVPLLGALIERIARRALVAERDREAAFVRRWLTP